MPTTRKAPRGKEALDPRVLPAFEARAKALGDPLPKGGPAEPAPIPPEVDETLSRASAGLTPGGSALLRALTVACLTRPHPSGRCEYRPEELMAWSGLTKKELSAEFPALCASGLCELSAIGSRNPKPCVRLPWLPTEGGKKE